MRRGLHQPTGQQYLAENVPSELSNAAKGDWRCPNPACGEPCSHVPATERHVSFFKHVVGVADIESCYYFAEETPTKRHHECVELLEGELIHRYGQDSVEPESWVDGISYPLDVLVRRPDGPLWGFWYVSPRRTSMTVNLLKQAAAAGVHVTIFTHVDARQPSELFQARQQPSFLLEPGPGLLTQKIDHKNVTAPLELWQFDEHGLLIPPMGQTPPPVVADVPRPPAPGVPTQPSFFLTSPLPDGAPRPRADSQSPITPVMPGSLPPSARGTMVWEAVDQAQIHGDLLWIIQAHTAEWGPQLLQWFLSRPAPFRISQACQFIAQRWRLHPSLHNQHDLVFLRAMHGFWLVIEQMGHVRIVDDLHPIYVYPQRRAEA